MIPFAARNNEANENGLKKGNNRGDTPGVLFLCVHNAGRSQMGLAWLRELGGDLVVGYSAGSGPAEHLNQMAVQAMAEVGINITAERPKRWTQEMLDDVDVVISMGCGDACPVMPGKRYVDWELEDPAGRPIETVRRVRDEIKERVAGLLLELL
jgi:arsenate reductase (thioredoxin)